MERRPFGRDWGLSLRMVIALVLLGALYLPFLLWLVAMGYFIWGGMVAVLVALGALGLLACAPYLSELLALSLARADLDAGPETIRLQPMLERLCAMADVPVPRLAVMPTDVPNAFSAGRKARNAIVVVTKGLVDRLDEEEIEAVLAHELAHIANRDAIVMTISAAPALLGRKLLWGFVSLPATSPSIPGKIAFAMLLLYLLPVVLVAWMTYAFATLLVMSISRYREFVADRGAALLTGAPEQLMSALQKIADQVPLIPNEDLRRASAMNAFFVLPARGASGGFEVDPMRMFPTHPPLARRLERLGELAREPSQHFGLAVRELVVDRHPTVPGRRDDAALRVSRHAGDELADASHDGVDVVRLHVDRAEGRLPLVAETMLESCDRSLQDARPFGEPGAAPGVRRLGCRLDDDGVLAARLGVLDEPAQDVFARLLVDRHQPNTR